MKDLTKGEALTNYKPITCLLATFRLLTGVVVDAVHQHLIENNFFHLSRNETSQTAEE